MLTTIVILAAVGVAIIIIWMVLRTVQLEEQAEQALAEALS